MRTLVIHPEDRSTDFLTAIYVDMPDCTVLKTGFRHKKLRSLIQEHDRIIMMGHGSPAGLFNINDYECGAYIIDCYMVDILREKKNCFYIWCNADQFVEKYKLAGFYTGMFISEVGEAAYNGITVDQKLVTESNRMFGKHAGQLILGTNSITEFHKAIRNVYKDPIDPVITFNNERFYYTTDNTQSCSCIKTEMILKKEILKLQTQLRSLVTKSEMLHTSFLSNVKSSDRTTYQKELLEKISESINESKNILSNGN